jgi:hypothetical protein
LWLVRALEKANLGWRARQELKTQPLFMTQMIANFFANTLLRWQGKQLIQPTRGQGPDHNDGQLTWTFSILFLKTLF